MTDPLSQTVMAQECSRQEGSQLVSHTCFDRGPPLTVIDPVPGVPTGSPTTTFRVWLITVTVPKRLVFPVLDDAETVNEPLPVPLAPFAMLSQLALGTADHGHQYCVITLSVAVPPPAGIATVGFDSE